MNINDVEELQELPEDLLQAIFDRQRELIEKYHPIEKANGLLITEDIPVDIHDAKGQQRLKDFAWRVTEELAEAFEAWYELLDVEHAKEELADTLHFFVEMCILSDITPEYLLGTINFKHKWNVLSNIVFPIEPQVGFIVALGQACNCLKNKPWKQTQMLTDVEKYKMAMFRAFSQFIKICGQFGIGSEVELFQLYFRKSEINKFRQRSAY